MRELGLIGSFWVYIWPGLIGVFNLIIIRSFIEDLPDNILESAKIDGAGDFRTFFQHRAAALHAGSGDGRAVYRRLAMELLVRRLPVQLVQLNSEHAAVRAAENPAVLATRCQPARRLRRRSQARAVNQVTPLSIRATMTIVASVPIIMVYPFLQKYFVKGMMVGGVKE